MSTSPCSPGPIHACRWDWCRETFDTSDRLAKHVLDDHVAKEAPVRREDIRLELRAFDGTSIGGEYNVSHFDPFTDALIQEDSIRTSLLINENASLGDEGILHCSSRVLRLSKVDYRQRERGTDTRR